MSKFGPVPRRFESLRPSHNFICKIVDNFTNIPPTALLWCKERFHKMINLWRSIWLVRFINKKRLEAGDWPHWDVIEAHYLESKKRFFFIAYHAEHILKLASFALDHDFIARPENTLYIDGIHYRHTKPKGVKLADFPLGSAEAVLDEYPKVVVYVIPILWTLLLAVVTQYHTIVRWFT